MGLLDQVLGSALGSRTGGGQLGGGQSGQSPIMMALMALLALQGRGHGGGGIGGMLGGLTGGAGGMGGGTGGLGGLGGLLNRFQQTGHGDIANSWVGSGENRQIAPNQLEEALGRETVEDLSRQTGMPRESLLSELSQHMPGVVDKMTPHGRMPNDDELSKW